MKNNETIRVSFELTPHEAKLTRHWLAKKTIAELPCGSIAKTMHKLYKNLNSELIRKENTNEQS